MDFIPQLDKDKTSKTTQKPDIEIRIELKSSILVFCGNERESDGALVEGRVTLHNNLPDLKLTSYTLAIRRTETTNEPFHKDCATCASRSDVLESWDLPSGFPLKTGRYHFSFSQRLPGILSTTSHNSLCYIFYRVEAHAVFDSGRDIYVFRPLEIRRVYKPMANQILKFLSTNHDSSHQIALQLTVPSLIHPNVPFKVLVQLQEVCNHTEKKYTVSGLIWSIQELSFVDWHACRQHKDLEPQDRYMNLRDLGSNFVNTRNDVNTRNECDIETGGQMKFKFQGLLNPETLYNGDVRSHGGFSLYHLFMIHIILAERSYWKTKWVRVPASERRELLEIQALVFLADKAETDVDLNEELPPIRKEVVYRCRHGPTSPPAEQVTVQHEKLATNPSENTHSTEDISADPTHISTISRIRIHPPPEEGISAKADDVSEIPPKNIPFADDGFMEPEDENPMWAQWTTLLDEDDSAVSHDE